MDVSIIVVSYNTRATTAQCLRSVFAETKGIDFEVVLVDNHSGDGSAEMIREEFAQVRLIENPANRGFAAANNQGLAIARGRYVLLLNSDTIVLDNAIGKTVAFADAHGEAAVVGCRVLNKDHSLQPSCFMFPSLTNLFLSTTYLYKVFPRHKFFGRERMTWWDRNDVREVDVVSGCYMLVRRNVIGKVGLLDERFFMYGEETDWCYRIKKTAGKILFTPGAEIIHLKGASSEHVRPEMILQLRGSILFFIKKHRSRAVHALACLLVAAFFLVRVPYWLIRALAAKQQRSRHMQTARTYVLGAVNALFGGRGLCLTG